jgi:hypothetical protein
MVPACRSREGLGRSGRVVVHVHQPDGAAQGDTPCDRDRDCVDRPGIPLGHRACSGRRRGLASGEFVSPRGPIQRRLRSIHQCDGGFVSSRVRSAGIRGRRLPRRRDPRSPTERASRNVRQRGHGDVVLCSASGHLARCLRSFQPDGEPGQRTRSDLCSAAGLGREGSSGVVHRLQHVPRHAHSRHRRCAHVVTNVRGRVAAACALATQPQRCPVGGFVVHCADGDRIPARGRPGMGDRSRELHLSHWDFPAQRRSVAAPQERTRPCPSISRPQRNHRARADGGQRVGTQHRVRFRAVRVAHRPPAAPRTRGDSGETGTVDPDR